MKKLVYIWLAVWSLWSCQKDEAYFDVFSGGRRCSDALSFAGG